MRFTAFALARNLPWSEFCSVAESAGAPMPPRPTNLPQAHPAWACAAFSHCSFRRWSGSRVIDMKAGSTNPSIDSPLFCKKEHDPVRGYQRFQNRQWNKLKLGTNIPVARKTRRTTEPPIICNWVTLWRNLEYDDKFRRCSVNKETTHAKE